MRELFISRAATFDLIATTLSNDRLAFISKTLMALSGFEIAVGGLFSIPVVGGLVFFGYKAWGEKSLDASKLKPKKPAAAEKPAAEKKAPAKAKAVAEKKAPAAAEKPAADKEAPAKAKAVAEKKESDS